MTLKELSQLYHLNREIDLGYRIIEELRAKAENLSQSLSDMPSAPSKENRLERYVAEIADLSAILDAKEVQCIHERSRLLRWINDIDDSLTRQIFTLRFVNGCNWVQVAASISDSYTDGYVKNLCYRFLKESERRKESGGITECSGS